METSTLTIPKGLREWRYYCSECRDSGMRSVWCGSAEDPQPFLERSHGNCGRVKEHYSHEFVVECPCASSNPDVKRRRERELGKRAEQ